MENSVTDYFQREPDRLRQEIREQMPEGCQMDEIDWLCREMSLCRTLTRKEPFPHNMGKTF